jgi:hypothetical protein
MRSSDCTTKLFAPTLTLAASTAMEAAETAMPAIEAAVGDEDAFLQSAPPTMLFPGAWRPAPIFLAPKARAVAKPGSNRTQGPSSPASPPEVPTSPWAMKGEELWFALKSMKWLEMWCGWFRQAPAHTKIAVADALAYHASQAPELKGESTISEEIIRKVYGLFAQQGFTRLPDFGSVEEPFTINIDSTSADDDLENFIDLIIDEVLEQLTACQLGALSSISEVEQEDLAIHLIVRSLRRDLNFEPDDSRRGMMDAGEVDEIVRSYVPNVEVDQEDDIFVYDGMADAAAGHPGVGHTLIGLLEERAAFVERTLQNRDDFRGILSPSLLRTVSRDLVTESLLPQFQRKHLQDGRIDEVGVKRVLQRNKALAAAGKPQDGRVDPQKVRPVQVFWTGTEVETMLSRELEAVAAFLRQAPLSNEVAAGLAFDVVLRARVEQSFHRVDSANTLFLSSMERRAAQELLLLLPTHAELLLGTRRISFNVHEQLLMGGYRVSLNRLARELGVNMRQLERRLAAAPQRFEDIAEDWDETGAIESFIARRMR